VTVLDIGPVMIRGVINARHARIVWTEGTLYVIANRQGRVQRQAIATSEPEPPKTTNGYWRMTTDEGQSISATRRGCGG
jgi:hypothetical protein